MRRKTTAVRIGNVVLSSEEPVLVQSMLNTSTREVDACVEQAIPMRSMQLNWKSCGRNLRSFWRFAGNMERLSASVRIMVRCPIVL